VRAKTSLELFTIVFENMKRYGVAVAAMIAFLGGVLMVVGTRSVNSSRVAGAISPIEEITDSLIPEIIDEQQQVDTILAAYRKLPAAEIARLGVDVTKGVFAGSAEAQQLRDAWNQRQVEIRQLMETVAKPVHIMEEIMRKLVNNSLAEEALVETLTELDSLVSDIDNARDFHTIGGWNTVVPLLDEDEATSIQALAALVIGTSIKNDYDFQLWTLETITYSARDGSTKTTCALDRLLEILQRAASVSEEDELQRRVLYGLAAAARGNPDVQNVLLSRNVKVASPDSSGETIVQIVNRKIQEHQSIYFASDLQSYPHLLLKMWQFVSDMVEERRYVQKDLLSEIQISDSSKQDVIDMKLLGEEFCTMDWMRLSFQALNQALVQCSVVIDNYHAEPSSERNINIASGAYRTIESILTTIIGAAKQMPQLHFSELNGAFLESWISIEGPLEKLFGNCSEQCDELRGLIDVLRRQF
jgi:hypothetical protein